MEPIVISITGLLDDKYCVAADEGQKVFNEIRKQLKEKRIIKLDFKGVEMLTSAFLNTAVGQLYGEFNENEIRSSMTVDGLSREDKALFKRVTDTAKLFYKDPERLKRSINEVLGE